MIETTMLVISWIGVFISMVAVYMSSRKEAKMYMVFRLYLVANVFSIVYFVWLQELQYTILNILYAVVTINGIRNNNG